MPRNNAQPMQTEAPPVDGRTTMPPGDAFGGLVWVRLTQREKPPRDRRRLWWVLALVLVGHAVVVWLVWSTPARRMGAGHAVEVTLIEPESPLPPPPPLVPPPPLQRGQTAPAQPAPPPPVRHVVPRAPDSMAATLESSEGKPLDLYGTQGQIRLPQNGPPSSGAPAYRAPQIKGAPVLTIKNPVKYKPTRFNKDWAPVNQTEGGKLFQKAVDATTVEKTVKLPGGIKVRCAASPLLILAGGLFGCGGMPPPPPPKNDNDIRLSMPPPETLTGKKIPLPSSASSAQPPANAGSGG